MDKTLIGTRRFTPNEAEDILKKSKQLTDAPGPGFITLSFGIGVLNGDFTNAIFFDRTSDQPGLQIPDKAWLHSVLLSAFSQRVVDDGQGMPIFQPLIGFPARMYMRTNTNAAILNVLPGTGKGTDPNPNLQPLVTLDGFMLIPTGSQLKFDRGQYRIPATMEAIIFEVTQPWDFTAIAAGQNVGLTATVVIAYD